MTKVATVRSATTFFLILHAAVGIEPLVLLDVVAREDDHIPAAHIAYTVRLESEAVHAEGNGRWIHVSYVPGNLKCEVIE